MKKILLAFTMLALCTGCAHFVSFNRQPIIIGGIISTGEGRASYNMLLKKAADLRIMQINEAGGINGRELVMVWREGECDRQSAAKMAEGLIKDDRVKVILTGTCREGTLGVGDVTAPNRILQIAPGGRGPEISLMGDYIFHFVPPDTGEAQALANFLETKEDKRVFVITEKDGCALSISRIFAQKYKGEIVERLFDKGRIGLGDELAELQQSKFNHLLLNVNSPAILNLIFTHLADIGYTGTILGNQATTDLLEEKVYQKNLASYEEVVGVRFVTDLAHPRFQEFIESYQEYYDEKPTHMHYMATTADAIDVLANVLTNASKIDNTRILRDGMSIVQHVGFSGAITFDENGDVRNHHAVFRYDGSRFNILDE